MKITLAFLSGIVVMFLLAAVTKINQTNFPITTSLSQALFMNCGNEVVIELPEGEGQPEYTVTGGTIIKGEERGKLTLIPEALKVSLTVSYKDIVKEYRFIAFEPPAPDITISIDGSDSGPMKTGMAAPGPASLLIRAEANSWVKTMFPRDARYKVTEWNVILVRGKRPVAQQRFESEAGNLKSFKNNAQAGDRILIEVVRVSRINFKGKEQQINMRDKTTIFNIPLF